MPSSLARPATQASPFFACAHASGPLCKLMSGLGLALVLGGAQAASFSGPLSVSLIAPGGITSDGITIDPTPLSLTQSLPPGGSILPGDGAIGGYMLSLEFIKLVGTTIEVRVAEGASNGTTGYLGAGGQHARYEFNNLNLAGLDITGLSFGAVDNFAATGNVGVTNLAALTAGHAIRLSSAHSLVLELDQIHFADRGQGESLNYADLRINLQTITATVPEASSLTLMLAGLAGVGVLRGRLSRRLSRRLRCQQGAAIAS